MCKLIIATSCVPEYDHLPRRFEKVRTEWAFRSDGPKTYWKEAEAAMLRK
jgi:hypothetical protein